MTKATISKWGNSVAIRLPKAITEAMHLHEGDVVNLQLVGGKATFEKQTRTLAPTLEEIVAEIKRLGPENEPETVDWGPDVGSERFYDHD
jgi:antitoxin MazE